MAAAKPKTIRHTSPRGIFVYPYLVKPDFGQGQFANTKGIYKVNLRLTEAEAEPLLAILNPIYETAIQEGTQLFAALKVEARKKLKSLTETPLYDIEYDSVTEEPTGNITFKFSTSASGVNAKGEAWTRAINLFDAKGNQIKPSMVGGGSEGKVSFEVSPYFIPATGVAGIKLYLIAAQILELSEGTGGNASSYGFGTEEGYEKSAADDTPFAADTAADDSNDKF